MTKIHLTYEFDNEDELRAHLADETRVAPTAPATRAADPAPAEPTPAPAVEPEPQTETRGADETDKDGMPYDGEIHSDPPAFTSDGLWRAKRGKADEAKAARAAFKAKGGDVTPPAAPSAMPGAMPSTLPDDAPAPVSLDRLIEKINVMITRGAADEATLTDLYAKHSGVSAAESFGVFQTNETARANLYAALDALEA